MQQSKPLFENFLSERSVEFWPSAANYLWIFPAQPDRVIQALTEAAILVRPKADSEGRMGVRITLGTRAQTEHLISVLAAEF